MLGSVEMPSKLPFRVIHASGQDEVHKANELNTHGPLTKGWMSSRFCLYPQDLVVEMDVRSRLRKIQILSHQTSIATRIEFYVGDVPDGIPANLQSARYTRLGYVELSDNLKTEFKARELKSVHVDAMGKFLKFVIHKNHVNKYNLYNQVGVVAVNVIGDPVDPTDTPIDDKPSDPALAGLFSRPDYISPLDDLAFDMYQDPEIAQIIRKLEKKKQEAVLQERYDYAKKLRQGIQELQKVGEKLGKFEVEKRQAVEAEDYDRAQLKKVQMEEYRLQVYKQMNIQDLLEADQSRHPSAVDLEPTRFPTPPRLVDNLSSQEPSTSRTPVSQSPVSRTPYDERPLPAHKKEVESARKTPVATPVDNSPRVELIPAPEVESPPHSVTPYDERPVGVVKAAPPAEDEEEEDDQTVLESSGGITDGAEQMSEKDLREASSAIDILGLPLVTKNYSKTWSFRDESLMELMSHLKDLPPETPKEDAKVHFREAMFLVKRGIKDQVFAVFKSALKVLEYLLTEFVPNHKLPRADTSHAVERLFPDLLQKTGDTAARTREEARNYVVKMSHFPEMKATQTVTHESVKPFKVSVQARLGISRVEIIEELYKQHGLKDSGLTVDNMMKFLTNALQHTSGQVRAAAERVIISMYKDGSPVKNYLPPDDEKTRKSTLYRQLFEAFDKIDGKPTKNDLKKQKNAEKEAKQKEIEALQAQLAELRQMGAATGKPPQPAKDDSWEDLLDLYDPAQGDINIHISVLPKAGNKDKSPRRDPGKKKSPPKIVTAEPDDDTSTVFNIDNQCIFCGERSEAFTEEGLDIHYWKSCPMLKRCANCKQVVEIAGLTEHLLTECEQKDNFVQDNRCSEAIPKAEYDQHIKEQSCNPAEPDKNHCPMCHKNFPGVGEEAWKTHLMGPNGCKQNPRRLNASKGARGTKPTGKAVGKGGQVKRSPRK